MQGRAAFLSLAVMMAIFFHAARLALVVFDPYLGSRALGEALLRQPPGQLIVDDSYYTFSSVFFYTGKRALLLNGRVNNLVYGSYAPGAPDIFLDDAGWAERWRSGGRYYMVAEGPQLPRLEKRVGRAALHVVTQSGGKYLLTNQ